MREFQSETKHGPNAMRELLKRAYDLALFLSGDEETASAIVIRAATNFHVAMTTQNKRLYYRPAASLSATTGSNRFRHKVVLGDSHLFQRLIYIESESYERQKELEGPVTDDVDLVIAFIKHLVRITLKRNSFYVALGISRLLYNYTTAEAMRVYDVVIQDPERVKDDYYYRSRKRILMSELKARFGGALRTYRGAHGEERFQTRPNGNEHGELVKKCLSLFTPWATACLVPETFDPFSGEITAFESRDSKEESLAEVNRIHSLIHPNCFERLITALGFDSTNQRLALPQFFPHEGGSMSGTPSNDPDRHTTSEDRLEQIEREIAGRSRRRRQFTGRNLRVLVDNIECARLDPLTAMSAQFEIERGAELLSITTSDLEGELPLATYALDCDDDQASQMESMRRLFLEGGQEVSVRISRTPVVTVAVHFRNPGRKAVWLLAVDGMSKLAAFSRDTIARPVVASSLAILVFVSITLIGLRVYLNKGPSVSPRPTHTVSISQDAQPERQETVDQKTAATSSLDHQLSDETAPDSGSKPNSQVDKPLRSRPNKSRRPVNKPPLLASSSAIDSEAETTREVPRGFKGVSLVEVRTIFVEAIGDQSLSEPVVKMLKEGLGNDNGLVLASEKPGVDAVLKVSGQTGSSKIAVFLVNVEGQVIWPVNDISSEAYYSGSPSDVAARVVADLLNDIRRPQRKRLRRTVLDND